MSDRIDLPALEHITVGASALQFKGCRGTEFAMRGACLQYYSWIDLPKLTSFTCLLDENQFSTSLYNCLSVDLQGSLRLIRSSSDLPALSTVSLSPTAFFSCTSFHISSMPLSSLSHADVNASLNCPSLPPSLPDSIDITLPNLQQLSTDLEHITIAHASGNTPTITELDFSRFQKATTINIGNHCFNHVTKLTISGLPVLECVKIGMNSFHLVHEKPSYEVEDYFERRVRAEGAFCLKDCPKVKELVMGDGVMEEAKECVIENVPALEEIVMGDMDNFFLFGCFKYASLELYSWGDVGEVKNRLAEVENIEIGKKLF